MEKYRNCQKPRPTFSYSTSFFVDNFANFII